MNDLPIRKRCIQSTVVTIALIAFATIALRGIALAQESTNSARTNDALDDAQKKGSTQTIRYPVELGTFKVKLTDTDGRPIPGAEVEASGLRCAEEPGSWYSWPAMNAGPDNLYFTDQFGQVEFKYPKFFGVPPSYLTTTTLTMRFGHAEFVSNRAEAAIADGKLEMKLNPGCHVEFSATDKQGKRLEAFGVLIANKDYSDKWTMDNGVVRTSAMPDGKWQTMLVAPQKDARTLFSGVLPTNYLAGQHFTIRNVILSPGLVVDGRLSDDVPRPIQDGIVVSFSLPKPTAEVVQKFEAISWQDSTSIAADGTFRLNSLPRSGALQLIAICRGWIISDQPRKANPGGNFTKTGVLFDLDAIGVDDNHFDNVELPMEAAGSLEVLVKQQDGSPLTDAIVSTWPNQSLEHSGTQLLGANHPTLEAIQFQIAQERPMRNRWRDTPVSRYVQKTDADGKVILYDIPLDKNLSVYVQHDDFQAMKNNDQPERSIRYQLDSPETKRVEIVVEPIHE